MTCRYQNRGIGQPPLELSGQALADHMIEDRLDNVHPGDILREEFRVCSEIPLGEVAQGT